MLLSLLKKYQSDIFPLLGTSFQKGDFCKIDLNVNTFDFDLEEIQTYEGRVHSFQYNKLDLDYGATIILQHELDGFVFYTLYGHLNLASFRNLEKGMLIEKGSVFTAMGNRNENGGWVPRLHFQIIKNMMGRERDFPGVASEKLLNEFSENCPDPNVFFVY